MSNQTVEVVLSDRKANLRIYWIESQSVWCAIGNFGFLDFDVELNKDGQWVPKE